MPGQPNLLIVPDLNILVADSNRYRGAPYQLLVFFSVFDAHNQVIETKQNAQWCLSKDLLQRLIAEFPWNLSERPDQLRGPVSTVLTAYLPVLQAALQRKSDPVPAVIIPANFLGTSPHTQPTRDEWLRLVASSHRCWQERQASFDGIFVASRADDVLEIRTPNGQTTCRIDVISAHIWSDVLRWANAALPRTGPYAYRPVDAAHEDFPRSRTRENQEGILDAEGNLWCWDLMHRDHWDVIDRAGNRVRRVRPDGRLFP